MWDNLWGDGAKRRAESNFNQLQDNVWKEFIDEGSQIVKFHNTQQSALSVLNTAYRELAFAEFHLEVQFKGKTGLKDAPFANQLKVVLENRIQNLEIERATTDMDIKGASERGDERLISTLVPKLKEVEMLLEKFRRKLYDNFEMVSLPSPLASAIDGPPSVDTPVVTSQPSDVVVPDASPSSSTRTPAGRLDTPLQPPLTSRVQPSDSPSHQPHTIGATTIEPSPPKGRFITRIIRSAQCWGDAIAERHDA